MFQRHYHETRSERAIKIHTARTGGIIHKFLKHAKNTGRAAEQLDNFVGEIKWEHANRVHSTAQRATFRFQAREEGGSTSVSLGMGLLQTSAGARSRVVSDRKWLKNCDERIRKV